MERILVHGVTAIDSSARSSYATETYLLPDIPTVDLLHIKRSYSSECSIGSSVVVETGAPDVRHLSSTSHDDDGDDLPPRSACCSSTGSDYRGPHLVSSLLHDASCCEIILTTSAEAEAEDEEPGRDAADGGGGWWGDDDGAPSFASPPVKVVGLHSTQDGSVEVFEVVSSTTLSENFQHAAAAGGACERNLWMDDGASSAFFPVEAVVVPGNKAREVFDAPSSVTLSDRFSVVHRTRSRFDFGQSLMPEVLRGKHRRNVLSVVVPPIAGRYRRPVDSLLLVGNAEVDDPSPIPTHATLKQRQCPTSPCRALQSVRKRDSPRHRDCSSDGDLLGDGENFDPQSPRTPRRRARKAENGADFEPQRSTTVPKGALTVWV